jgi:hypothetical protein
MNAVFILIYAPLRGTRCAHHMQLHADSFPRMAVLRTAPASRRCAALPLHIACQFISENANYVSPFF